MSMKRVGTVLFAVGLAFAVLLGATADLFINAVIAAFMWTLVLFGIVVGITNSAKEETEDVLYTVGVLVIAAFAATELARAAPDVFGSWFIGAARGVLAYMFPIALIIGAKRVYDLAH